MNKIALITGITGMDGSHLAELLLSKGYEVHGLIRRSSSMCNRKWIDGLDIELHYGDLIDAHSLNRIIEKILPDEIYNLAAQSHVGISFDQPVYTMWVNTIGTLNLLEILRKEPKKIKMYQASTSEMLANYSYNARQKMGANEFTPFEVHSPYACSKLAAHELCKIYREAYGLFISCGILFNHESSRRSDNFVTQKIIKNLVKMKKGLIQKFELGNIDACRDWGYSPEYMEAAYRMLQQDTPDDYVIATNETHSVREFIEECCNQLEIKCFLDEGGFQIYKEIDPKTHYQYGLIPINKTEKRAWDVDYLRGDYSKAKRVLGWTPKVTFKELIKIMIEEELKKYE